MPENRARARLPAPYEGETILCVNNLSRFAQSVELDLQRVHRMVPLELWAEIRFPPIGELPVLCSRSGRTTSLVPAGRCRGSAGAARGGPILTIAVAGALEDALEPAALRTIDAAVLGEFLRARRWFGEKSRRALDLRIADVIPIAAGARRWAIARVEVTLEDGARASYQLPLGVRSRAASRTQPPVAAIARIESRGATREFSSTPSRTRRFAPASASCSRAASGSRATARRSWSNG